jgi:hypothetical protein
VDNVQRRVADHTDLTQVLADEMCGYTTEFKPAVLAALIRIEKRLAELEPKSDG